MKILLPASKIRKLLIILAALVLIYFVLDPAVSHYFPKCPFYQLTGYKCPGCGSQRAVHYLLHLELKDAFLSNPLLVIAIPYILGAFIFDYTDLSERYPQARKTLYGTRAILIVLVMVISFWIIRNL